MVLCFQDSIFPVYYVLRILHSQSPRFQFFRVLQYVSLGSIFPRFYVSRDLYSLGSLLPEPMFQSFMVLCSFGPRFLDFYCSGSGLSIAMILSFQGSMFSGSLLPRGLYFQSSLFLEFNVLRHVLCPVFYVP